MRKDTEPRPILPVCLLVEQRPCLVVGGGTIATRKAKHLLDAGAAVSVVSPDASQEMKGFSEQGRIEFHQRAFRPSDVDGMCLVFATTDNRDVNRQVLQTCKESGVLCSASDSNWPDSDFVMPATCRQDGVVVTVSTGGRSCREARIIKDGIAANLKTLVETAQRETSS